MNRGGLLRAMTAAVAAVLVWGIFQTVSGLWILSEVQKRAKVKIEGQYRPDFLMPSFRMRNVKLVYEDRFEATAGLLKIRYNLIPLSPDLLHIWIHGEQDMKVRLLGKWASSVKEAEQEAPLERFETELQLVKRGILLHAADIQSPVFQFQLKKSDHFKGQPLG